MKTTAAAMLILLAALTGCARQQAVEPSASPTPIYTNSATCEDAGGVWHSTTAICTFKK